jgi:hypothetical protein
VLPYIRENRLDLCFDFDLAFGIVNAVNFNDPSGIRAQLQVVQAGYPKLQYATFLTNHDINRVFSTLENSAEKMKQAASIYLTLPGVPFVYYGEEVGMQGTGAHENIRRPMQWTSGSHAGFSTTTPWQSVGSNYTSNNVEVMAANPASVWNQYRTLIQLRNRMTPLRRGYLLELNSGDNAILSYARVYEDQAAIVVSNFAETSKPVILSQSISSLTPGQYRVTNEMTGADLGMIEMDADGGFADWMPSQDMLAARETWILGLTPAAPSFVGGAARPPSVILTPNPVTDRMMIRTDMRNAEITAEIYNQSGVLFLLTSGTGIANGIDLSSLVPGFYYAKVFLGDGFQIIPFVKAGE